MPTVRKKKPQGNRNMSKISVIVLNYWITKNIFMLSLLLHSLY